MTSAEYQEKAAELEARLRLSAINEKGRATLQTAISLMRKIAEETKAGEES